MECLSAKGPTKPAKEAEPLRPSTQASKGKRTAARALLLPLRLPSMFTKSLTYVRHAATTTTSDADVAMSKLLADVHPTPMVAEVTLPQTYPPEAEK